MRVVHRLREWWQQTDDFDRVGTMLAGWEFISAVAILLLLPLMQQGRSPVLFRLIAADLVGLGTALVAWLATLLLAPRRGPNVRIESLQDFVRRRIESFQARGPATKTKKL
ncbi:MAG: hypothetical protein ACYTFZ_03250 [Planctomycetota bacterium]